MPFDVALNFRSTSTYVIDSDGTTYLRSVDDLGLAGESYPVSKTANGYTFNCGWLGSFLIGNVRDRDNSAGHEKLAGVHWPSGISYPEGFQLDLPQTGTYRIRAAFGDPSGGATEVSSKIWDGAIGTGNLLATIGPVSILSGQFRDASNVTRTSADDWLNNNAYIEATFANTTLTVTVERDLAPLTHLAIALQSTAVMNSQLLLIGVGN